MPAKYVIEESRELEGYIRYGMEMKRLDSDDADFVRTVKLTRQLKRSKEWKTSRRMLLKGSCEQCESTDTLCFMYLWKLQRFIAFKDDMIRLIARSKPDGFLPSSCMRECCPVCQSVAVRSRMELVPEFICANKHEFDKPDFASALFVGGSSGRGHKSALAAWDYLSGLFGRDIRILYGRIYRHLSAMYTAGAGAVTWCQQCYRRYRFKGQPSHPALGFARSCIHGSRLIENLEMQAHEESWLNGLGVDVSAAFQERMFSELVCNRCGKDMFIAAESIGRVSGGVKLYCRCGSCSVDAVFTTGSYEVCKETEMMAIRDDAAIIRIARFMEPITDDLIDELSSQGWLRDDLISHQANGMLFNRARNSFVGSPDISDGFFSTKTPDQKVKARDQRKKKEAKRKIRKMKRKQKRKSRRR